MKLYDIPGYENKYAITEDGKIFSYSKNYGFGCHKDKWLKSYIRSKTGYLALLLGRKNPYFVHQLVALTFLPKIRGKNCINHIDGDKLNNHFSNLEWCTNSENSKLLWLEGKLKEKLIKRETIRAIRRVRRMNFSMRVICEIFKLGRSSVDSIIRYRGRFKEML